MIGMSALVVRFIVAITWLKKASTLPKLCLKFYRRIREGKFTLAGELLIKSYVVKEFCR